MCGFSGVIWKHRPAAHEITAHALAVFEPRLTHRGPDERGTHVADTFGVVHRRLAIIDRSFGHQPMTSADGRVGVAYNGEIYNHVALRQELEAKGHVFTTRCDTEVVLRMFVEYGVESFDRLDGMFALFLWDERNGSVPKFYLARDHLGTKPLYIYEDSRQIAFSSELRPLLSLPGADLALDPAGLQSYLSFRYTQTPGTFYKRIRRVEAGHYWRVEAGRLLRTRYWDLPNPITPLRIPEGEARESLVDLLRKSVAGQQMAEVPIGLLLSGGLDSSVIAYLCHELGVNLKCFNIGFPSINEFAYSSEVAQAFGLEHVAVETTIGQIAQRFDRVVEAMDEPLADPACWPLYMLCERIKESVTVVLSGEGSDEMLAGYPQYQQMLNNAPESASNQFSSFLGRSWYFLDNACRVTPRLDPSRLLQNASYFWERPLLEGMLAYDLKTWLPENLMMKADKILMSHSLEGRFPFLSKTIVEFVCSLPEEMKLGSDGSKHLLRRAFNDRLPRSILKRPKMGFSVPLEALTSDLKRRSYDLLDYHSNNELSEFLDFHQLRRQLDAHYSGANSNALWVWTVTVLLQWFSHVKAVTDRPNQAVRRGASYCDNQIAIVANR